MVQYMHTALHVVLIYIILLCKTIMLSLKLLLPVVIGFTQATSLTNLKKHTQLYYSIAIL